MDVTKIKRRIGLITGFYFQIKRFTASASEDLRNATLMATNNIDTIIDIGANKGQFAESLFELGYKGKIISFEPIKDCHDLLLKKSKKYSNWIIADRCAIGDFNGHIEINITRESVFSSLLKTKEEYSNINKNAEILKSELVPIHRLDSIIEPYIENYKNLVLKIDTQGFEKQVIDGANTTIEKIKGIKIEIPLNPIYDGVKFTFYEIIEFLKKEGFKPYSFNNEGVNLKTGRLNTIDGLFFREN